LIVLSLRWLGCRLSLPTRLPLLFTLFLLRLILLTAFLATTAPALSARIAGNYQ
jgi:hypothetical protein